MPQSDRLVYDDNDAKSIRSDKVIIIDDAYGAPRYRYSYEPPDSGRPRTYSGYAEYRRPCRCTGYYEERQADAYYYRAQYPASYEPDLWSRDAYLGYYEKRDADVYRASYYLASDEPDRRRYHDARYIRNYYPERETFDYYDNVPRLLRYRESNEAMVGWKGYVEEAELRRERKVSKKDKAVKKDKDIKQDKDAKKDKAVEEDDAGKKDKVMEVAEAFETYKQAKQDLWSALMRVKELLGQESEIRETADLLDDESHHELVKIRGCEELLHALNDSVVPEAGS